MHSQRIIISVSGLLPRQRFADRITSNSTRWVVSHIERCIINEVTLEVERIFYVFISLRKGHIEIQIEREREMGETAE